MTKKVVETSEKKLEKMIYIGPSFEGVSQFTTFEGVMPESLTKIQKDCPSFKKLLVGVEKFKNAFDNLSIKNSEESVNFLNAINHINKLKKGA